MTWLTLADAIGLDTYKLRVVYRWWRLRRWLNRPRVTAELVDGGAFFTVPVGWSPTPADLTAAVVEAEERARRHGTPATHKQWTPREYPPLIPKPFVPVRTLMPNDSGADLWVKETVDSAGSFRVAGAVSFDSRAEMLSTLAEASSCPSKLESLIDSVVSRKSPLC